MAAGTMSGDVKNLLAKYHLQVGDKVSFKADMVDWQTRFWISNHNKRI